MLTKEERRQRYIKQHNKAVEGLMTNDLYDYIEGLKYALSFCLHYKKNLYDIIHYTPYGTFTNPFKEVVKDTSTDAKSPLDKCLKAGILRPWKDTYWFDKDKAESLQMFILEHRIN